MNAAIIYNFQKTVSYDDDLYLLGDIFLGPLEEGMRLFRQLPGKIHLVYGNHDTDTRLDALADEWNVYLCGYAELIHYNKYHFYLSHFPSCTTNFDDYKKPLRQRTLCLAGHTHSKELFEPCGSYNVAVDAHDCYPVSIDKVISDFNKKYPFGQN